MSTSDSGAASGLAAGATTAPEPAATPAHPSMTTLFRAAVRALRRGAGPLVVYLVAQAVVTLLLMPFISWLFRDAVGVAGLRGIDQTTIGVLLASPLSVVLLVLLALLAAIAIVVQLLLVLVAIRRALAGAPLRPRALARDVGRVLRRLAGPGALAFAAYLFLILPLAQTALFSELLRTITIPSFITDELLKTPPGIAVYVAFIVAIALLNTRLALTLPVLVSTTATGGKAMLLGMRLVTGSVLPLIGVVATIVVAGAVAGIAIGAIAWGLTRLAELVPATADTVPIVASVALGAGMLAGAAVAGLVVIAIGGVLLEVFGANAHRIREADRVGMLPVESAPPAPSSASSLAAQTRPPRRGLRATVVAVVAIVAVGALSAGHFQAVASVDDTPSTLILAHRGFGHDTDATPGGVENTISALDAAAAVGTDLVEIDVMQTADGGFVVMHDADLSRLAGVDRKVGELTLDELTATEVHDLAGHSDRIPSLAEFIGRADELGMALLIEMKLHGLETPDHVARLVDQLEELGALDRHIYHSLDPASVETLKRLRPHLWVGLIIALAGETLPDTSADFIVVEASSYSEALLRSAHDDGLSVFVWTINDEQLIRDFLRRGVDGLLTDRPDLALPARGGMGGHEPLSDKLVDLLRRWVVVV